MLRRRGAGRPRRAARAPAGGAQHRDASRPGRSRRHFDRRRRARRARRAARRAARARRLLRARRPLPAALFAADDRDPGARRRRPRRDRRLPAAGAGRDGGGARSRRHAALSRRRRARDRGARVRHRDDSARGQDRRPRQPLRRGREGARLRATARSTSTPARPRSSIVAGDGPAGVDRRRPHRAGRARSRRARRSSSPGAARLPNASSPAVADAQRRARHRPAIARRHTASRSSRASPDEAMALANRIAPEHLVVDREALIKRPAHGRRGVRRPVHRAGGRRLRDRFESRAADRPAPPASAAALSAADFVRVMAVQRLTRAGPARASRRPSCRSRAPRVSRRTPSRSRCGCIDEQVRQKPPELYDGLRLHQNENTGGCSPRVLEALARAPARTRSASIRRTQARPTRVRGLSRRRPDRRDAVNGLDEGIMAAGGRRTCAPTPDGPVPEAIIPEPAFEIFALRHGGRRRPARAGDAASRLPFRARRRARRDHAEHARRVPDQPEQPDRRADAARRDSQRSRARVPPGAVVFVDEAYAEFSGADVHSRARRLSQRHRRPHVLEGVRARRPAHRRRHRRIRDALEPIRLAVPVYSVNIAAVAAVQAALEDRDHLHDYLRQVEESKALALRGLRSAGARRTGRAPRTSCCVRAGDRTRRARRAARSARGIYLRDRSTEPGCAGCLRIATGIVEHTRRVHRRAWKRSCAPRGNRSPDDRDPDRAVARARRQGPVPASATGIRFLDHMLELFARHGAFDLRSRPRAISTSISITRSRISASRSAKRSRRRSATGAASTARATS